MSYPLSTSDMPDILSETRDYVAHIVFLGANRVARQKIPERKNFHGEKRNGETKLCLVATLKMKVELEGREEEDAIGLATTCIS